MDLIIKGMVELIPFGIVTEGDTLSPAVWSKSQEIQVQTRDVYKYKAQINIDGYKMRPGVNYNQTYALVAAWEYIRILLSEVL